jgi:hypothetical protein
MGGDRIMTRRTGRSLQYRESRRVLGAELLDALCAEVDRLIGEVERLREEPNRPLSMRTATHRLRLEVERLREQQKAFQRTPPSNDGHADDDVNHEESDDSNTQDPADRGRVLHRRPVRLILALSLPRYSAPAACASGTICSRTNRPMTPRSTAISIR